MFCKKCGKELEDGTAFCKFCGKNQAEDVAEKAEKKEAQISNKQLFLAGAVMAAVILAVIAGFRLIGGEKETNLAENTVEEEAVKTETDLADAANEKPVEEAHETTAPQTEGEMDETAEEAEAEKEEKHQISHIVAGENEFWFDEDGDLVRAKSGSGTLDISYLTLTDSAGEQIKGEMTERLLDMETLSIGGVGVTVGGIGIGELLCNSKGHMLKSYNCDYGEDGTSNAVYTYDGENITEIQRSELIHEMEEGIDRNWNVVNTFRYDEDKIFVSYHNSGDDYGTYDIKEDYIYCFEGNKVTEYVLEYVEGSDPEKKAGDIYIAKEYDNSGNIVKEKEVYCDTTWETVFQYDNMGNLIRSDETKRVEDSEMTNGITISKYQYDENGNGVKQEESETQETKGSKEYEDYTTIEYQFDEKGNKIQNNFKLESLDFDEDGTVVRQRVWERNYIWEYDAEDRLTYHSYLGSSPGFDIYKYESAYLYDEQGRLTEISTDGETAMEISYTDEGILRQIDVVKELEDKGVIEWNVMKNLFPNGEMDELEFCSELLTDSGDRTFLHTGSIVIEYR